MRTHTPEDTQRARRENEEDNLTFAGLITPQVHALTSPNRHHPRHRSTPPVKEAFSSIFLSLSLWPTKAEKLSDPPTISDLQPNLITVASFRPTHQSCRYQTHLLISPLLNPPAHLAFFKPTHRSVVLYQNFLLIYLSLSLSHDRCLYLRKTEFFFLLYFIVDLVYIFRFCIIIFVWKLRKFEKMCLIENFQIHNQTPEIILHWTKCSLNVII